MFPNIPWKTAGGKVFWDTIRSYNNWRLQKNIFTDHYRILDPMNVRRSWGIDEKEMNRDFDIFTGRGEY